MPSVADVNWYYVAVNGALALLVLYVAFFKSYFREKGKNVATFEDIERITEKIESVRTDLQYSLQSKLDLRAEEQASVVNVFAKFRAWYGAIIGISFSSGSNRSRLEELRSHIDHLQNEFDAASAHMELFVTDSQIVRNNDLLRVKTLELMQHAVLASFAHEELLLELEHFKKTDPPETLVEKHKALLERQSSAYKSFKQEQVEYAKALIPLIETQKSAIASHVREIAKG